MRSKCCETLLKTTWPVEFFWNENQKFVLLPEYHNVKKEIEFDCEKKLIIRKQIRCRPHYLWRESSGWLRNICLLFFFSAVKFQWQTFLHIRSKNLGFDKNDLFFHKPINNLGYSVTKTWNNISAILFLIQLFRSHTQPYSKNQNKGWDAALMMKMENTHFSTDSDIGLFAQQDLIAITGLYLTHILQRKMCTSVYMTENLNITLAVIALSKRMPIFAELKLTLTQTILIRNLNAEILLYAVLVEIKF